jgi:hypothetical protein
MEVSSGLTIAATYPSGRTSTHSPGIARGSISMMKRFRLGPLTLPHSLRIGGNRFYGLNGRGFSRRSIKVQWQITVDMDSVTS